jgi:hypothetical protein
MVYHLARFLMLCHHRQATIHDSAKDLFWWKVDPRKKIDLLVECALTDNYPVSSRYQDIGPLPAPYSLITTSGPLTPTFLVLLIDGWCPKVVPFEKLRIRPAIKKYCQMFPPFLSGEYAIIAVTMSKYFKKEGKKLYWDSSRIRSYNGDRLYGVHIDLSQEPLADLETFPEKVLIGTAAEKEDDLQEPRESTWIVGPGDSSGPNFRLFQQPSATRHLGDLDFTGSDLRDMRADMAVKKYIYEERLLPVPVTMQLDEAGLIILPTAFFSSIDWLSGELNFSNLDFDRKSRLRNAFSAQLREVSNE